MLAKTLFCGLLWITAVSAQFNECNETVYKPLENVGRRGLNIPKNASNVLCDQNLPKAWYRIDEDLVTERVPVDTCGTAFPVWMNASVPTVMNQIVEVTVCSNRGDNLPPCENSLKINVINCGPFRVYELEAIPCPGAYCINANTTGELNQTATFGTIPPTEATTQVTTEATTEATTTTAIPTTQLVCVPTGLRPMVMSVGTSGKCNTGSEDCSLPSVILSDLAPVEDTMGLSCRFRETRIGESGPFESGPDIIVPAQFVGCTEVVCPLPTQLLQDATDQAFASGWYIAVGRTAAGNFGTEKLYIPHDYACATCNPDAPVPTCSFTNGTCYINGSCFADNTVNPDNQLEECLVALSVNSWSPNDGVTAPSMPTVAATTPAETQPTPAETTPVETQPTPAETTPVETQPTPAETTPGETQPTPAETATTPAQTGECMVGGTTFADGEAGTLPCQYCNFSRDPNNFSLRAGFCLIGGACVTEGTAETNGSCKICIPEESQSAYTQDSSSCLVGGVCYRDGESNPDNRCMVCQAGMMNSLTNRKLDRVFGGPIDCSFACTSLSQTAMSIMDYYCTYDNDRVFNGVCYLQDETELQSIGCLPSATMTRLIQFCGYRNSTSRVMAIQNDVTACP